MKGHSRHIFLLIFIAVVSAAVLSGCGSSRHAAESHTAAHYSKKLTPAQEKELVREAKRWLGTKYRYGGHSRSGTDCSGMVMEVYKKVCDVRLPRSSREQQSFCKKINRDNLRKGDLVFFSTNKSRNAVSHVGLYIGDGEMIHASSSKGVMISRLDEKYFQRTYHSSGRVLAAAGARAIDAGGARLSPQNPDSEKEMTLDEFINRSTATNSDQSKIDISPDKKQKVEDPEFTSKILDDVIDQKIDSIYSTMFD